MPDYYLPSLTPFGYLMLIVTLIGFVFCYVALDLETPPRKFYVRHPVLLASGMLLIAFCLGLSVQDELGWLL